MSAAILTGRCRSAQARTRSPYCSAMSCTETLPARAAEGLRIEGGASQVRLTLDGAGEGDVHHLEHSGDLVSWLEVAFSNGAFDRYGLPSGDGAGFYRVRSRPADDASDWTNQLGVPDGRIFTEPGAGGLPNNPAFAKFTVKLDDPGRVWFQDSDRYPYHYNFVFARLPGYQGIGYQQYESISLHLAGQELLLGTVMLAPDGPPPWATRGNGPSTPPRSPWPTTCSHHRPTRSKGPAGFSGPWTKRPLTDGEPRSWTAV